MTQAIDWNQILGLASIAIIGFAILVAVLIIKNTSTSRDDDGDPNWIPPKPGEMWDQDRGARRPRMVKVISVGPPDKSGMRYVRVEDPETTARMTHLVRKNGIVHLWNVEDE